MPDTELILIVEETEQRTGRFHAARSTAAGSAPAGRRCSAPPARSRRKACRPRRRSPCSAQDSAIVSLHATVGAAAGLIVTERDRDIPRFEPWKATPAFAGGSNLAADGREAAE